MTGVLKRRGQIWTQTKRCTGRKPCDNRGREWSVATRKQGTKQTVDNHHPQQKEGIFSGAFGAWLQTPELRINVCFISATLIFIIYYVSLWKQIHSAYHLEPGQPWNEAQVGHLLFASQPWPREGKVIQSWPLQKQGCGQFPIEGDSNAQSYLLVWLFHYQLGGFLIHFLSKDALCPGLHAISGCILVQGIFLLLAKQYFQYELFAHL